MYVELRSDAFVMSSLVNQPGELVGEAIDVVDELFADPMVVTIFFLWCYDQVFCPFSQKAGVPMLRGSFWDHYNGFRFVSADFCCHLQCFN